MVRVILIGCVKFSHIMLQQLMLLNVKIVGIITQKESNFNSDFFNLGNVKIEGAKYLYTKDINSSECVEFMKILRPDYIFCIGWSSLIKQNILDLYPVIGYHPAALPKNRGRHPLIWALALGLEETASTFFFMNEQPDAGDIISQHSISITQDDDASTLYNKVSIVAKRQIEEICVSLENGNISRTPQKVDDGNTWRKRTEIDGRIDFRMTSDGVYNLVRALTRPYPGAYIEYEGKQVKIWKVKKVPYYCKNIESGKIMSVFNGRILVKTYDGAVEILEHDFLKIPLEGEYII